MDDTGHLYALEILKPHRRTVHAAQHELRQSQFIHNKAWNLNVMEHILQSYAIWL